MSYPRKKNIRREEGLALMGVVFFYRRICCLHYLYANTVCIDSSSNSITNIGGVLLVPVESISWLSIDFTCFFINENTSQYRMRDQVYPLPSFFSLVSVVLFYDWIVTASNHVTSPSTYKSHYSYHYFV